MKKAAFTVVEAIVVLFVIVILGVLLFPLFAKNREQARRHACQSNLKQICLGFKQYSRDYDELFPRKDAPGKGSSTYGAVTVTHWVHSLQPYLKSVTLFQCPADPSALGTDYYYNGHVSGRNETIFWDSSRFVLLTEGADRADCSKAVAISAQKTGAKPAPYARHLDGSNYAFLDGHVKWLHFSKAPVPMNLTGAFTFRGRYNNRWAGAR